jgi:hypothetical protein
MKDLITMAFSRSMKTAPNGRNGVIPFSAEHRGPAHPSEHTDASNAKIASRCQSSRLSDVPPDIRWTLARWQEVLGGAAFWPISRIRHREKLCVERVQRAANLWQRRFGGLPAKFRDCVSQLEVG